MVIGDSETNSRLEFGRGLEKREMGRQLTAEIKCSLYRTEEINLFTVKSYMFY